MKKGFSLIEALLSLTIMGFIVYSGAISFLNLIPKYRLQSAIWEINSCLNVARYRSIVNGMKIRLKFNASNYTIEVYDDHTKEWKLEKKHFLEGVFIKANNTPIFHPLGTVSNLASIYVFNSWGKYKVTIAISGRIKVTKL